MQVSHNFKADSAVFDDDNLVSCAGLVPVMVLAAQSALPALLADNVHIAEPRIKSGAANPAPKLATLIAAMCAGADSIDDVDVVRSGGMKALFGGVYAPSTIGTLLREFSFGHARQLESVLRQHLSALCDRVDLLPGADVGVFIDIDSLLRPVYGHAKQGASYGHTKIAGKQVLRKGLSPLAATISTDTAAPVIAGMRLRAGKSGSGKGAARMVAQAIATARAAGVTGQILVRGDSAYGTAAVVAACRRAGARFSLVLTKNPAVAAAIDAIAADAWTPVRYPGAVRDPDALGLAFATAIGAAVGVAIGASRRIDRALTPSIDFVAAIPGAALVPVAVLLLGPTRISGVVVVALIVSWPILLNAATAMRSIPAVRLEMSRTVGLSAAQRWREVVVPSLAPGIMLGVRVASAMALIITLLVDILGAGGGIGRLLVESQQRFDAAAAWGLLSIIGAFGYLTSVFLTWVERRGAIPAPPEWPGHRPSVRTGAAARAVLSRL